MQAGAQLTPTLELVREIGRGAMGSVWEARNTALGTPLAVKLLRPDTPFTEDGEARFEREIEVLASLDHPHLVRIVDRGKTAEGGPFFVMEYLRGEDLGARLEREGTLSVDDTVTIVSQACRALAVAHERGIVHRDIKPPNLFLLDDGGRPFVKVLDFGIAKRIATEFAMTSTGISVGTPYFMSPEQFFTPSTADHRADLWALGIVAYACLTGAMPFVGETPSAIGLAAMQHSFTPVTQLRGDLGPSWDTFFARALRADPARRFQSAIELAEALRRAQTDCSSTGPITGVLVKGSREALSFAPTEGVALLATDEGALAMGDTVAIGVEGLAAGASPSATGPTEAPRAPRPRWVLALVALATSLGAVAIVVVVRAWPTGDATLTLSVTATDGYAYDLNSDSSPTALSETPSGAPSPPPSESSTPIAALSGEPSSSVTRAPTSTPNAAPTAVARTDRAIPITRIRACWADTDGAAQGNPAASLAIEVDITPKGKVAAVRLNMLGKYGAFRRCATQTLTEMNFGPGAQETLRLSLALSAPLPR